MKSISLDAKGVRAQQLDEEIETLLRDFIPLGQKLMEMRDSRLYLELENPETGEPFGTFEEYCRIKKKITRQQAQEKIRASLVVKAIAVQGNTLHSPDILPDRQTPATVLADAVAEFDYEVRDLNGRGDKVPVSVANPDELRKVWDGVARKYVQAYKQAKDKKPKLTASFITKALPPKYRRRLPNPLVTRGKVGKTGAAVKAAGRLVDAIHNSGLDDLDKLKELAEKERWTTDDVADVRGAMKEAEDAIGYARDALGRLRI